MEIIKLLGLFCGVSYQNCLIIRSTFAGRDLKQKWRPQVVLSTTFDAQTVYCTSFWEKHTITPLNDIYGYSRPIFHMGYTQFLDFMSLDVCACALKHNLTWGPENLWQRMTMWKQCDDVKGVAHINDRIENYDPHLQRVSAHCFAYLKREGKCPLSCVKTSDVKHLCRKCWVSLTVANIEWKNDNQLKFLMYWWN